MDNPRHNHVILTVGNIILENNLDADNKFDISQFLQGEI